MWLHVVVLSLLCGRLVAFNKKPGTWLIDKCEKGLRCFELKADSFDEYVVELQTVFNEDNYYMSYHHSKKGKAPYHMTPGDSYKDSMVGRTIARHPIYMDNLKFFVQLYSDRVEVISFRPEGAKPIATDSTKWGCFRIMSEFPKRRHINADDVKHSFIYKNYLFINSTTAIDLNKFMKFKEVDKLATKGSYASIHCRLQEKYWGYGMVPIETIGDNIIHSLAKRLSSQCFRNATVFCSIDQLTGDLVITKYPVALRLGKFVMEQRWTEVIKDNVAMYRFHHMDMPSNQVFYFPKIPKIYGELIKNGKPNNERADIRHVRGIMPIPRLGDKIFKLMEERTTPIPTTQTTTTTTLKPIVVPTAPPRPERDIHNATDDAEEHGHHEDEEHHEDEDHHEDDEHHEDEDHHEEESATSLSWRHVPQMTVIVGMIYVMIIG